MNHYEALNYIPTEQEYNYIFRCNDVEPIVENVKQKLETYKVRGYGLTRAELDIINRIYHNINDDVYQCANCNNRLIPIVVLQWIYNYETKVLKQNELVEDTQEKTLKDTELENEPEITQTNEPEITALEFLNKKTKSKKK